MFPVAARETAPAGSFARDVRLVGTVSVAHFASHLFQLALPSLFPILREALGVPYAALGAVMTVFYITSGSAVMPLGFGWLLDRGEPRLFFAAVAAVMLVTIATVIQVRRRAVIAARA
jgi:MFS transporter, FSR family, fosmidomycin resistance protein